MKWLILLLVSVGTVVTVLSLSPWMSAFFFLPEIEEMPKGKQFYVSPNGSGKGDGSLRAPWDLRTAFSHPPAVKPGDVINLRAGTYRAADEAHFACKLKGTEGKYILVQPYPGESALIESGVQVEGPWIIIRDLEVASNDPDRSSDQNTSFPTDAGQIVGFNVFASNVKIVNNIVHDNSAGLDAWAQAPDNEYYGNLIYYNGWQAQGKRAHGHGLYMQNSSGIKYIRDNIIFNQFASGMQLYGSEKADLNNFHVEGNIVFNNGALNHEHNRNILIGGGRVAKDPVVKDNYMYFPPQGTLGGDHNIGYNPFGVGCTGLKFTGNYMVSDGPALNLFKCTVEALNGNTFYGDIKGFPRQDYPENEYFDRSSPPRGIHTFVRANRYELGRANIVIFNWSHAGSVTVDLSRSGLQPGDRYELHSAQDYFGDVSTGGYDGKPITISMMNRSVASPAGVDPPPSTFPEFGAFVIRKAAQSTAAAK